MNWLFPGFLAGGLAVAIPIALHLLRRYPPQPTVFPSLMFLATTSRQLEHRWQRLRRWLVLALRCGVFLLLAAAFGRPYLTGARARANRAVVVVVDNSFSLQTNDRWSVLRRWVRGKVGTPGPGDRLGVLLMAPQPTWLVAPTSEVAQALHALDELSPGWLAARAEPALRLAGDTLAALPADRRAIIYWGDHQRLSWSGTDFRRPLPAGIDVMFPDPAPAPARQAALQKAEVEQTEAGLAGSVTVRNFSGPQKRTLRIYAGGRAIPLFETVFDLAANEARTLHFPLPDAPGQSGWFRFALDPDDVPADDTAYAIHQPDRDGTVLLDPAPTDARSDFVAAALAAVATSNPPLRTAPVPAGPWPTSAIAILRNDATFARETARLDAFLAAGGGAIVFATDGENEKTWLGRHHVDITPLPAGPNRWRVERWAVDHPLVAEFTQRRFEDLLGWEFTRGWGVPISAAEPLAYWSPADGTTSAAVAELRIGTGSLLICGFATDRRSGEWAVTPAFVPFLHRAAVYLVRREGASTHSGTTGEPIGLGDRTGRWESLEIPVAPKVDQSVVRTVTPMVPGIYRFTSEHDATLFAINVPPAESDPAMWTAGTPWMQLRLPERANRPPPAEVDLAAADAEEKSSLWWWAVALAIALMLAEVGLANRTAR